VAYVQFRCKYGACVVVIILGKIPLKIVVSFIHLGLRIKMTIPHRKFDIKQNMKPAWKIPISFYVLFLKKIHCPSTVGRAYILNGIYVHISSIFDGQ
jgi:hypothetical protein